jgi:serine/threonine protein kinase
MLTGSVPFAGDGIQEIAGAILSGTVPEPSWDGRNREKIRPIIARCLKRRPEDRYESVSAFLGDLDSPGP